MDEARQKQEVKRIFNRIAGVYDFLNRLLSLRQDVHWRDFTARCLRPGPTGRVLDVATGTGDLALAVAARPQRPRVMGLDLVPAMLKPALPKIARKKATVSLMAGDATSLPFGDGMFDAVTIAFGIRNIPDRLGAMREMRRVLVRGGRLYVLEFTTPQAPWVIVLYRLYLRHILPLLGGLFSGDSSSYAYLADTIMEFPSPENFRAEMLKAGLAAPHSYSLTHGIAWLHIAEKT
jgi:demethylmenaquinone methyltransferase/2-methoxy-6-polyprenyl-1,4-benzoquinol methylase